MQVVHFGPTQTFIDGKTIVHQNIYNERAINFSETLSSSLFELEGLQWYATRKFHQFKADVFRAPNGKSANIVQALPGTRAFEVYGKRQLYLAGLKRSKKDNAEMILLATKLHSRPMPYAEFNHV